MIIRLAINTPLVALILLNTYGGAKEREAEQIKNDYEASSAVHDDAKDRSWEAFKTLVLLLSNEQAAHPSQALQACQQKLAKGRIPRELHDLLPDICAYVLAMRAQMNVEQERVFEAVSILTDMKQSFLEMRAAVDEAMSAAVNATPIPGCQTLSIRNILCKLDAKLTIMLSNIQTTLDDVAAGLVAAKDVLLQVKSIVDASQALLVGTIIPALSELQAALDDVANRIDNVSNSVDDVAASLIVARDILLAGRDILLEVKATVEANNVLLTGVVIPALNAHQAHLLQLEDVVGTKDQYSSPVFSVGDIDAKELSVIEWLKSVSRQLLEVRDCIMPSGHCFTS